MYGWEYHTQVYLVNEKYKNIGSSGGHLYLNLQFWVKTSLLGRYAQEIQTRSKVRPGLSGIYFHKKKKKKIIFLCTMMSYFGLIFELLHRAWFLHFLTHRTQGPARLVIHLSSRKSTGFPKQTLWISQKSIGPLDLLITNLAGPPENSPVGTGDWQ